VATKTRAYNPAAYVPGGSSTAVAKAIQAAGYARPGPSPIQVPRAATAASTTPSGGGDGGGGGGGGDATFTPFDFNTDPGYLAALAAEQAGSAQLDAAERAARISALVNFGDPGLAQAFGVGDVDPLTAAMAQQNTQAGTSTLAQLQRQRDLTQASTVNQLAAHGLIRSGDLGWRTGQNAQDYATSLYNAQQGVLGSLADVARQTATQKQQLQSNTVGALTSAYNTYVANPQYYGMAQNPVAAAAATPAATAATAKTTPTFTAPAVQTTVGYTGGGPMGGWSYPVSRLATPPNPYAARTARNVRAG
jgi:hypothetical protein